MDTQPNHDSRALTVVSVVREITEPEDILLFGSRARGDWNDTSDIDILTIADTETNTRQKYRRALAAGQSKALEIYGHPVKIDLVRLSPADFHLYRQAKTHITHAVAREGISMSREATGCGNQYEELEPNNWPDVEQRFTNYQRQALAAGNNLREGLGYEEVGHNMQRCLENALKGFLAYMEYDDGENNGWMRTHDTSMLQNACESFAEGQQILQGRDFSFLTEYAIDIPYAGVQNPMQNEAEALEEIGEVAEEMMQFIQKEAKLNLPRYIPPGPRN